MRHLEFPEMKGRSCRRHLLEASYKRPQMASLIRRRRRTKFIREFPAPRDSETVSANRVAAINPPIDDTDPIRKFSIDPGSHMDLQNPAEVSPKGKPIRNLSIDRTSSIRTSIADAIFAEAISETPKISAERAILTTFQAPNFEVSEPEKNAIPSPQPFHAHSHSVLGDFGFFGASGFGESVIFVSAIPLAANGEIVP